MAVARRIARNIARSAISEKGWYAGTAYLALDAANQSRAPSIVADFRKQRYAKPKLGPELAVNGNFDANVTGWTSNFATVAWDTSRLKITTTNTGDNGAYQDVPVTVGEIYCVTATVTNNASVSTAGIRLTDPSYTKLLATRYIATGQTLTVAAYVVANAASLRVGLERQAASGVVGDVAYFDNVSVRKVLVDQLTDATFSDIFTFNRGSTATYIDQNGAMKVAANDVPRFDYSDGVSKLLLEGPSTNCASVSNPDTSASQNSATLSDVFTSKSPTGKALRVTRTTSGTVNQGYAVVPVVGATIAVGDTWTISAFIKPGPTGGNIQWTAGLGVQINSVGGISGLNYYGSFVNATATTSAKSFAFPDGWFLIQITSTATATGSNGNLWLHGGRDYTDAIGSYCDYANAQIEKMNHATSLIPTTGSAVTRGSDSCALSPLATAVFSLSSMSALVQGRLIETTNVVYRAILGGGKADFSTVRCIARSSGGQVRSQMFSPSSTGGDASIPPVLTSEQFGYASAFTDGVSVGVSSSGTTNVGTNVGTGVVAANDNIAYLGRRNNQAAYADGLYDQLVLWSFRMQDTSLALKAVAYGT